MKKYFHEDLFGLELFLLIEDKVEHLGEKESKKENPSRIMLQKPTPHA